MSQGNFEGGRKMKGLYKTTIVVWTKYDPSRLEINRLAQEAMDGSAYCSVQHTSFIEEPQKDPDWDHTEFFSLAD